MKPSQLSILRQYTAATAASISVIILGMSLGWPSPVLLRIEETNHPFSMSSAEISWMVSLLYFGNLLSPIPAGYLMDRMGRKTSLLILGVIPMSAWLLIIFAYNANMLYVARLLAGTWSGIVSTIAPMYLGEISEPKIRGALSTFVQMMTNMGVVFEYIVGPRVSYQTLGIISGCFPILFICIFSCMPESPYWQIMKGKKEDANHSLMWLRGETSTGAVKEEMELMEQAVMEEMRNKRSFKDLVATRGNRKALIIVEVLALIQRMSGISALMAYTSTTLPEDAAGSLERNDCVVVMGMVWLVSVFIATVLVDSLGRKPLLYLSCLGCGIAMFAAGTWFFLDECTSIDVTGVNWLPFAAFLVYGLFFCIGLGPIASTVQGEAFPTNIKGLASGITSVVLALTSFLMNKIYHPIAESGGMFINYWIFSASCFAGGIFVVLYVVETKGKSLHQIQEALNVKKSTSKTTSSKSPTVESEGKKASV